MKTTGKIVFLTALLLGASLAMAGPEGHGQSDPGAMVAQRLAGAIKRLDLEAEQEAAIRALFRDNREALMAHGQASRALREEIRTLLEADTLDDARLAELATREGELAEERVILMTTLASAVQAELTEAQRAELASMREERLDRRSERRQERLSRRNPE